MNNIDLLLKKKYALKCQIKQLKEELEDKHSSYCFKSTKDLCDKIADCEKELEKIINELPAGRKKY